jgi:DNA-binding NtrC family response regulator
MDPNKMILGKRVLIVDDEEDVLETLTDLLDLCKVDTASSFEKAKTLLENHDYDIAVLDIMGVRGFDLLEIARKRGIPALMLTAHALSEESLKRSATEGAAYYVPKQEIERIATFVADVLEAKEKNKNPWVRWAERLSRTFDVMFTGPDWREKEKEFWDKVKGRDGY